MPPVRTMPSVRTMPMIKPVKTERSHEENQERAYIAASRRSDRSLEARVESARRASEIHKRRTGRSLRVREEDVMNEEMYEEEDDDVPSHLRRINALTGLTGPFSSKLQSSLAMQLGMRDALSQALLRNQEYQNANASMNNANGFMGGMMGTQNMMMSNNAMQSPYTAGSQNWQTQQQQFSHGRSISIASPQDLASYQQQQQQQMHAQYLPSSSAPFNLHLEPRRMSMPVQSNSFNNTVSRSPVDSPTTPYGTNLTATGSACQSPQQVPTPPQSASAHTPGSTTSAGSPKQMDHTQLQAKRTTTVNSDYGNSNPLSLQLPMETQQLLGMGIYAQQGGNNAYFSSQHTKGSPTGYHYNPNGSGKGQRSNSTDPKSPYSASNMGSMYPPSAQYNNNLQTFSVNAFQQYSAQNSQQQTLTGLNQTISPSALWNLDGGAHSAHPESKSTSMFSDAPSSAISAPADFMSYGNNISFGDECSMPFGSQVNNSSGWDTPGASMTAEPSWNPEDFVNFGPPT